MQQQKQSEHGGTGEQQTEIGSTTGQGRDTFAETHPEDPNNLETGSVEDEAPRDDDAAVRNPAGDAIGAAVDGDDSRL